MIATLAVLDSLGPLSRGELAALGASLAWAIASLVFSRVKVPAAALNLIKNLISTVLLLITIAIVTVYTGELFFMADGRAWGWLALSSVTGLLIGDTCYFRSIQILGARRGLVLTTLSPPFATILGRIQLGERAGLLIWTGMAITLIGVATVVRERGASKEGAGHYPGTVTKGVLYGLAGALCQAVGAAWSKEGMGEGEGSVSVLEATFIRVIVASAFGLVLALAGRRIGRWWRDLVAPGVTTRVAFASFCGTYVGVGLSLVAYKYSKLAVSTTLTSLPPIFVLPLVWIFLRQPVSRRAIVGAMVAVVGIVVLVSDRFQS